MKLKMSRKYFNSTYFCIIIYCFQDVWYSDGITIIQSKWKNEDLKCYESRYWQQYFFVQHSGTIGNWEKLSDKYSTWTVHACYWFQWYSKCTSMAENTNMRQMIKWSPLLWEKFLSELSPLLDLSTFISRSWRADRSTETNKLKSFRLKIVRVNWREMAKS